MLELQIPFHIYLPYWFSTLCSRHLFPVLVHAKLEQANVNKFEMHCWISQFVDNILQSNDCLFFNASLLLWKKTSSRYKIVFRYIQLIQKTFQMINTFKQKMFLWSQSFLYQCLCLDTKRHSTIYYKNNCKLV